MEKSPRGLKFIREYHKLSLERLAEILGISKSSVAKWENGTRGISPEARNTLAEVFNLPEQLFSRKLSEELEKEISDLIINVKPDFGKQYAINNDGNTDLDEMLLRKQRIDLSNSLTTENVNVYLAVQQILTSNDGKKVLNILLATAHDYLNIPSLRVATGGSDYDNGIINRNDANISKLVEGLIFLKDN